MTSLLVIAQSGSILNTRVYELPRHRLRDDLKRQMEYCSGPRSWGRGIIGVLSAENVQRLRQLTGDLCNAQSQVCRALSDVWP